MLQIIISLTITVLCFSAYFIIRHMEKDGQNQVTASNRRQIQRHCPMAELKKKDEKTGDLQGKARTFRAVFSA